MRPQGRVIPRVSSADWPGGGQSGRKSQVSTRPNPLVFRVGGIITVAQCDIGDLGGDAQAEPRQSLALDAATAGHAGQLKNAQENHLSMNRQKGPAV
jgi:hypothetical protein